MKAEIDLLQNTFYKSPSPRDSFSPLRNRYHTGVFEDDTVKFNVLLLGGAEAEYFKKKKVMPQTEITDPDVQLHGVGLATVEADTIDLEIPRRYVQDSEWAREQLLEGKFTEQKPSYRVTRDPVADANF